MNDAVTPRLDNHSAIGLFRAGCRGDGGAIAARGQQFRPEIQGLRAVAVLLVLVYHTWPERLPGGFIGVDVFFVISGYLITSLLLKELAETGSLSLGRFYARRARRLLPAALTTLMAIAAATYVVAPITEWRRTAVGIAAAAAYFENWRLAAEEVDYLAIGASPSATQHFWSLSVEEQFYLGWPLLLIAGFVALRRRRISWIVGVIGVVAALSLAVSIGGGLRGDPAAYFSTLARIWQLATGGIAALLDRPGRRGTWSGVLIGLVAIALAACTFSGETSYPGLAALVPTVGATLVIACGRAHSQSRLTAWLGWRPVQFVGDVSYSLYLWHWPVILFWTTVHDGDTETGVTVWAAVAMWAIAFTLAAISKRWIEDPFRRKSAASPARVAGVALAGTSLCLLAAYALYRAPDARSSHLLVNVQYPGAEVMVDPRPLPPVTAHFRPALVDVEDDVPSAYAEGCIQAASGTDVRTCAYGSNRAQVRLAIVGDSHAVHWLPAFQVLVEELDLQVVAVTKTSCSLSGLLVQHPKRPGGYTECIEWARKVLAYLTAQKFDIVVISESPNHRLDALADASWSASVPELARALERVLRQVAAAGSRVVVLRSTPWHPGKLAACVAKAQPPYGRCAGRASAVLREDALVRAATAGHFPLIDLNDLFCRDGVCPPIIGNVFVYRDSHHVTATFMRSLARILARRLGLVD